VPGRLHAARHRRRHRLLWRRRGGEARGSHGAPADGADRAHQESAVSAARAVRRRGHAPVAGRHGQDGSGAENARQDVRVPHVRERRPRLLRRRSAAVSPARGGGRLEESPRVARQVPALRERGDSHRRCAVKVKAVNGFARILKAEGIPWVSCYPTSPVNNALGEEGVPILMMGEERFDVAVADAFSRVTCGKQIGACTVMAGLNAAGIQMAYGAVALSAAKDPLLFVGEGVLYADATAELLRFAEAAQVPVLTTLKGKSAFPENHPLSVGVRGSLAERFLRKCDLLFAVGASLFPNRFSHAIPDAERKTIVQCTVDTLDLNRSHETRHAGA